MKKYILINDRKSSKNRIGDVGIIIPGKAKTTNGVELKESCKFKVEGRPNHSNFHHINELKEIYKYIKIKS